MRTLQIKADEFGSVVLTIFHATAFVGADFSLFLLLVTQLRTKCASRLIKQDHRCF
jgi:hypothetical protein